MIRPARFAPIPTRLTVSLLAVFCACFLAESRGQSLGTANAASPDLAGLPQPVSTDQFKILMENSPFTRSLNLSDRLILTGIADMDGKKVATLMNKETKETYVVSEQPNPQGWKMVEVAGNQDLEQVAAKIAIDGGEVVTVRYDEWSLKPGEAKPAGGGGSDVQDSERRPEGRRGPSPEMRERMMSLSEEKRRKLFEYMMKLRSEKPDMSWEERGAIMQKAMQRLENSD